MNQIVINIDEFQSRAAIIEDGKVVEILVEREEEGRINGSIYKGKVANVLPGMESAFVNIGLEKNGFLYVNDLREFEEKYGRKIPVALAGGIEGKEQVKRAFELGADAVQVATRFVTTEECDADIRYKEAYIKAEKEDIIIVKSPVGMPGRAIRNAFMERVIKEGKIPHSPCHQCLHSCNPKEIPYCITDALINAAKGETEQALLFCGAYAYKAKRIETVKEVIASLLPEPV